MSGRPSSDFDRELTARFVSALDQLPVPVGPGRLLPRSAPARAPRYAIAAIVLVLAIAIGVPPVREAIAGAFRWLDDLVGGPAWVGYYVEQTPFGTSTYQEGRLMFTSGRLPGVPTVPVVEGEFADHSPWSPAGDRVILTAGPAIYVGDRAGNVRKIGEVPQGFVWLPRWAPSGEIIADAYVDGGHWILRVDPTTGRMDRRQLMANLVPQSQAAFSPDGEWLVLNAPTAGSCYGGYSSLYEIGQQRAAPLLNSAGDPLFAIGWTADGRLISTFCDRARAQSDFFVSRPDSRPTVPFAVLPWAPRNPLPRVDPQRDRLLVSTQDGATPGVVSALSFDGRLTEVVRLPRLTDDDLNGDVQHGTLSTDGRFMSFRVAEAGPDKVVRTRAGLINVITGQVMYACAVDCTGLSLR
jgi:hypothetical protein